ncbi:DUF2092 domain-containing protein [Novosphingobium album (ex Hu et al. 2023)]|uniref:DUF2092 domain-containing protein n=1 Tax=Novosphingobium album (ex Hu et al. 2023) TaxID=2930093 RepID=A0ABT0B0D2_9SPHN|nr:DUF2092 domain-containing protein [Novosphingobium album (ex Hu et al. 2023)]MCJ2178378.1 DUF2092 domain-containing protein [Novosphingobium album (ex Hu et al. 2023)]
MSASAWAQAADQPEADDSLIDQDAFDALDHMAQYLQTLTSFEVKSDVTTEVVLEGGQKVQFGGALDLKVHRPDAFKIVAASDTRTREMYYDGKLFTIYAPVLGYYADFAAPPTIGLTLDKARTEYDIEIPLADLFTWGTDQTIRARIKEALVIRPEHIGNRTCMHYAFRQEKVDWQLWLEESDKPLPCKIIITSRVDPAMPQYTAVLHWDTAMNIPASTLAFTPPATAKRITIAEAAGQKGDDQ